MSFLNIYEQIPDILLPSSSSKFVIILSSPSYSPAFFSSISDKKHSSLCFNRNSGSLLKTSESNVWYQFRNSQQNKNQKRRYALIKIFNATWDLSIENMTNQLLQKY